MNLAVHGLAGDIRQGVTYYEDLHKSMGKFDFVMANPPFNVNGVDKERLKDDPRYSFGLPRTDNGNYLWIQVFYSALNGTGRFGRRADPAGGRPVHSPVPELDAAGSRFRFNRRGSNDARSNTHGTRSTG